MYVDGSPSGSRWATRELTSEDQEFLWDMLYIALWDPPDEPPRPRSVLELPRIRPYVEEWGGEGDFGIVALSPDRDERIGAIWARLEREGRGESYGCPYPELGIAVVPAYQGKGVGLCLMAQFIGALRTRTDGLRLGVHPENMPARRLYEKMGFVEYAVGPRDYPQMKLDFGERRP